MKGLLVVLAFAILAGCDERPSGEAYIMTDENGKKWVVSHHMGKVYTLKPLSGDAPTKGEK